MQAIGPWQKRRQSRSRALIRCLSDEVVRHAVLRLTESKGGAIKRYFDGYLGKGVLAAVRLYAAPLSHELKDLSVKISSIKRPWSSRISILIRLKW